MYKIILMDCDKIHHSFFHKKHINKQELMKFKFSLDSSKYGGRYDSQSHIAEQKFIFSNGFLKDCFTFV